MTLDERIKRFRGRPRGWDKVYNFHLKLIYDLIDARYARATLTKIRAEEIENLRARVGVLTVACAAAVIVAEDLIEGAVK